MMTTEVPEKVECSDEGRSDVLGKFVIHAIGAALPTIAAIGLAWGILIGPQWLVTASVIAMGVGLVAVILVLLYFVAIVPLEIAQKWRSYSLLAKIVFGTIAVVIVTGSLTIVVISILLLVF